MEHVNANHMFAGLMVSDLARANDWYAALLGREPDVVPNDRELMWQLTTNANLYLLCDPGRAGRGVVTIAVSDLRSEVAAIGDRGVKLAPIEQIGTAGSKAVAVDPDGNEVHLIELAPAA